MSVAKASLLEPLTEARLSILPRALVIGGGLAGMNAALELARQGFPTDLVERENHLGGAARRLRITAKGEDVQAYLEDLAARVRAEPDITVHLAAEIKAVDGFVGNFKTTLAGPQGEETVEHGVAILATGAAESRPTEYLYSQDERVVTHLELDSGLQSGRIDPRQTRSVVFIQCVGSRSRTTPTAPRSAAATPWRRPGTSRRRTRTAR